MKKTQVLWVKSQLNIEGEISRNTCLRNYISRLGAIIHKLKDEGYEFKTERRGGDYVYIMTHNPHQIRTRNALGEIEIHNLPI